MSPTGTAPSDTTIASASMVSSAAQCPFARSDEVVPPRRSMSSLSVSNPQVRFEYKQYDTHPQRFRIWSYRQTRAHVVPAALDRGRRTRAGAHANPTRPGPGGAHGRPIGAIVRITATVGVVRGGLRRATAATALTSARLAAGPETHQISQVLFERWTEDFGDDGQSSPRARVVRQKMTDRAVSSFKGDNTFSLNTVVGARARELVGM